MIMMFKPKQISYEIRKGLHYLFFVFAIAMCFHVPTSATPNGGYIAYVLGSTIVIYSLDRLCVVLFMTERVEPKFQCTSSGVQMSMAVSDRFLRRGQKGGFCYVCLPWVDKQWHAFSLFQDPSDPNRRAVFMLDVGSWTHKVYTELQLSNTSRPVWIQGPFASPYKMGKYINYVIELCTVLLTYILSFAFAARDFDKQILVSTGVGITASLSAIEAYKESRTIFLVWSTRDASLVEFFLENYHYLDHKYGFNFIYYTGQTPLNPTLLEGLAPNTRIIYSRPNLNVIIPNIIHTSEYSDTNSQYSQSCPKCQMIHSLLQKSRELDLEAHGGYQHSDEEKLEELMSIARNDEYDISDLSDHFQDAVIASPFTIPKPKLLLSRSSIVPEEDVLDDGSTIMPNASSLLFKRIRKYADTWGPTLHSSRSVKMMNHNNKTNLLSRWCVMYCGGSDQVKGSLKRISKEFGIDLHYESFAW